jgi:hypothetical protein
MSLFYKFQYLVGMKPWERMPSLPIGEPGGDGGGSRGCHAPDVRVLAGSKGSSAEGPQSGGDRTGF